MSAVIRNRELCWRTLRLAAAMTHDWPALVRLVFEVLTRPCRPRVREAVALVEEKQKVLAPSRDTDVSITEAGEVILVIVQRRRQRGGVPHGEQVLSSVVRVTIEDTGWVGWAWWWW